MSILERLSDIKHSLQFANDSLNGPIQDTIWMMHSHETVFDAIDSIIEELKRFSKPVAWAKPDDVNDLLGNKYSECIVSNEKLKNDIPLYTHPHKQLSDEEIKQICDKTFKFREFEDDILDFARAIIKEITE